MNCVQKKKHTNTLFCMCIRYTIQSSIPMPARGLLLCHLFINIVLLFQRSTNMQASFFVYNFQRSHKIQSLQARLVMATSLVTIVETSRVAGGNH